MKDTHICLVRFRCRATVLIASTGSRFTAALSRGTVDVVLRSRLAAMAMFLHHLCDGGAGPAQAMWLKQLESLAEVQTSANPFLSLFPADQECYLHHRTQLVHVVVVGR